MVVQFLDTRTLQVAAALLRHVDRAGLDCVMFVRAALDVLDPSVIQSLRDADAFLRDGVHHAEEHTAHGLGVEVGEYLSALRTPRLVRDELVRIPIEEAFPAFHELCVLDLTSLGGWPRRSAKFHGQIHDGTRPDVEGTRVVVACR